MGDPCVPRRVSGFANALMGVDPTSPPFPPTVLDAQASNPRDHDDTMRGLGGRCRVSWLIHVREKFLPPTSRLSFPDLLLFVDKMI
jgi:hypothetical protein